MIHHDVDPVSVRPGHQAPISVLVVLHGRVRYWTHQEYTETYSSRVADFSTNDDDVCSKPVLKSQKLTICKG